MLRTLIANASDDSSLIFIFFLSLYSVPWYVRNVTIYFCYCISVRTTIRFTPYDLRLSLKQLILLSSWHVICLWNFDLCQLSSVYIVFRSSCRVWFNTTHCSTRDYLHFWSDIFCPCMDSGIYNVNWPP